MNRFLPICILHKYSWFLVKIKCWVCSLYEWNSWALGEIICHETSKSTCLTLLSCCYFAKYFRLWRTKRTGWTQVFKGDSDFYFIVLQSLHHSKLNVSQAVWALLFGLENISIIPAWWLLWHILNKEWSWALCSISSDQ